MLDSHAADGRIEQGWLGICGRTVKVVDVGCRRLEIQEPGPVVRRRDTCDPVRENLRLPLQDWSNDSVESPHALQAVGPASLGPAEVSRHLKTQRIVPYDPR